MQSAHSGPSSQPQSLSCHICAKPFPSNFAKLQHLKKVTFMFDTSYNLKMSCLTLSTGGLPLAVGVV